MSCPPPSSYRPDIDGLRGLAVLVVVLFHAGFGFKGGYIGVDLFFVISGYLITGHLFKELGRGSIDLAAFWERRLRRITPALVFMLCGTLAAASLLLFPADFMALGESLIAQALLCANIYFWNDSGYFAAAAEEKPLLHLWSLAVEEQFYLLVPLGLILGAYCLRRNHAPAAHVRTRLVQGMVALLILSLIASIIGVYLKPNSTFYWLPTRAWELLLGGILATLPGRWAVRSPKQSAWASAISLLFIFVPAFAYRSSTPFPGAAALLPCLGAAGIIWAHTWVDGTSGFTRGWAWKIMAWRPLVAIGLISYSLYLWHWPLLALAQYANVSGEAKPAVSIRLAAVLAAFFLAWFSWKFVETPFRQKRWFKTRRSIYAFGLGSSLLFIALGWQIIRHQGMPARLPTAAVAYASGSADRGQPAPWASPEAAFQGHFPQAGNIGGTPTMMLWGDSHARSLVPVLDTLCQFLGVTLETALYSATCPTLGFHRRSLHGLDAEQAEVLAQAVLKRVQETGVRHTLLAAYWKECPGKQPEDFAQALVETVRALKAAGTQPWIILDVPEQPFEVPRALALSQLPGGLFPDARPRATSRAHHLKVNAVMQALIPRLEAAGARVLDPLPYLTGADELTLLEAEGRSLYFDSHHLSATGAHRLLPLFEVLGE